MKEPFNIQLKKTAPSGVVQLEYLYLDLQSCTRCISTDQVLDEVMLVVTPALQLAGYQVEYHKLEMDSKATAEQYQFLSSPTVRVNGRDICSSVQENDCGCCSEISGTAVECRVFVYQDRVYEVPPPQMLAEHILRAVFAPEEKPAPTLPYVMPENLKSFFEGKEKNTP